MCSYDQKEREKGPSRVDFVFSSHQSLYVKARVNLARLSTVSWMKSNLQRINAFQIMLAVRIRTRTSILNKEMPEKLRQACWLNIDILVDIHVATLTNAYLHEELLFRSWQISVSEACFKFTIRDVVYENVQNDVHGCL